MFFGLKAEVIKALRLARIASSTVGSNHAVRAGEFGHHKPAAALRANETAEDGVRDASHGRKDGSRCDLDRPDVECFRKLNVCPRLSILTVIESCKR